MITKVTAIALKLAHEWSRKIPRSQIIKLGHTENLKIHPKIYVYAVKNITISIFYDHLNISMYFVSI